MATITDILISELDPAILPATGSDELVINQLDSASGEFVTRRIAWTDVGGSLQDLSGDINFPGVKQILFADGTELEPSITFKSDQSTGIYKPKSPLGSVAITSSGSEVLRATPLGVGIGFINNEVPTDSLHIKRGGALIEFGSSNSNSKLHFTVSAEATPVINTTNSNQLSFATDNIVRGKFKGTGEFEIYNAFGVGNYTGGVPTASYGDDGDLLLSQGSDKNPIWSSPTDFISDNITIIGDILVNDDTFIELISGSINIEIINDQLDEMNIGQGLDIGTRNDNNGGTEQYLYNTFIFGDGLINLP